MTTRHQNSCIDSSWQEKHDLPTLGSKVNVTANRNLFLVMKPKCFNIHASNFICIFLLTRSTSLIQIWVKCQGHHDCWHSMSFANLSVLHSTSTLKLQGGLDILQNIQNVFLVCICFNKETTIFFVQIAFLDYQGNHPTDNLV